jgi:hypothetical protein
MRKKLHIVRIVIPWETKPIDGGFVDCLRYAGVLSVHDTESAQCLEISAPKGLIGKVWAEQNAARMRSFGYNAVAVEICR